MILFKLYSFTINYDTALIKVPPIVLLQTLLLHKKRNT